MVINDTLARSLKDRFFHDFERDARACYREVHKLRYNLQKRSRWVKAARADLNRFHRFSLGLYEGGSEKRPYFATNILASLEDRPFNAWNEKCLFSIQILYAFDPSQIRWATGLFNIGEHAVTRLYLRSPVEEDARGNLVPYSILKQFSHVPFWATFWTWLQYLIQCDGLDCRGYIAPVVPAPDGLFLSKFRKDDKQIEIRTFVGVRDMSDERKYIRDLMIGISEPLLQSPMSVSPVVELGSVDLGIVMLTTIVCRKLLPHAETITKALFRDSEAGPRLQRDFVEHFRHYADNAEEWWDAFHSMPLRKFLTEANKDANKLLQEGPPHSAEEEEQSDD